MEACSPTETRPQHTLRGIVKSWRIKYDFSLSEPLGLVLRCPPGAGDGNLVTLIAKVCSKNPISVKINLNQSQSKNSLYLTFLSKLMFLAPNFLTSSSWPLMLKAEAAAIRAAAATNIFIVSENEDGGLIVDKTAAS